MMRQPTSTVLRDYLVHNLNMSSAFCHVSLHMLEYEPLGIFCYSGKYQLHSVQFVNALSPATPKIDLVLKYYPHAI